ncbi:hypothetical protein RYX36_011134 [Vicia faba]
MDQCHNKTHFGKTGPSAPSLCTPQWQPPSSPSFFSPPWQPSSTPQWGLNGHNNRPPSTPSWFTPQGQTSSTPSWFTPQGQTSSTPSWFTPQGLPPSTPSWFTPQGLPPSTPSWFTPQGKPPSTPSWFTPQGQTSSTPSWFTPQGQPPSTPQWGLNGHNNQPPSTPSLCRPQGQPPSTPSLCRPWPQWGHTSHNQPPFKVVLNPVQSERNITDLATKIQRVARGYLVRKSVKKMLKIKVELEKIKKKVNDEETVKMIKEVQMESMKIDESLTNLLLRLDSVRGFHCSALRGFRRSLVKRAVFLQEFVYQIQTEIEENEDGDNGKCVRAAMKIQMVARGYLVRKSVKKMLKIKVELEKIKKKVNDEETVKMIKEVQMESMKIDESLTNLLLRLDSVRGFHCSALRGFRRSLVKRAVFLQEFVYQIQTEIEENEDGDNGKCVRAAMKIQMVARGYLVRESMKKMLKIKVELDEIEKKVNDEETVKIMKKEQEERIRMDGAIMDLLLRLDYVRVFRCSALRGFRRSLLKRAIFLQEFVDQIQMVNEDNEDGDDGKCVRAATKIQMVARGYLVRKGMKKMMKIKVELEEIAKKVNNEETVMIMKKEQKERTRFRETIMNLLLRLDSFVVFHCSPLRDLRKSLINRAIFLDEFVDQIQTMLEVEDFEVIEDVDEETMEVEESVESCLVEEGDGGIDSEMLTRMMDGNREMLRMIMDYSEKQTSVLTSLTQRVEQLEIAFTCDKNRRYAGKT